jgi:hypothetical protein
MERAKDATSEIYSMILVDEEASARASLPGLQTTSKL